MITGCLGRLGIGSRVLVRCSKPCGPSRSGKPCGPTRRFSFRGDRGTREPSTLNRVSRNETQFSCVLLHATRPCPEGDSMAHYDSRYKANAAGHIALSNLSLGICVSKCAGVILRSEIVPQDIKSVFERLAKTQCPNVIKEKREPKPPFLMHPLYLSGGRHIV